MQKSLAAARVKSLWVVVDHPRRSGNSYNLKKESSPLLGGLFLFLLRLSLRLESLVGPSFLGLRAYTIPSFGNA